MIVVEGLRKDFRQRGDWAGPHGRPARCGRCVQACGHGSGRRTYHSPLLRHAL